MEKIIAGSKMVTYTPFSNPQRERDGFDHERNLSLKRFGCCFFPSILNPILSCFGFDGDLSVAYVFLSRRSKWTNERKKGLRILMCCCDERMAEKRRSLKLFRHKHINTHTQNVASSMNYLIRFFLVGRNQAIKPYNKKNSMLNFNNHIERKLSWAGYISLTVPPFLCFFFFELNFIISVCVVFFNCMSVLSNFFLIRGWSILISWLSKSWYDIYYSIII